MSGVRALFAAAVATLVACASVADLDVKYQPDGVAVNEAGADGATAPIEAGRVVVPSTIDAAPPARPAAEPTVFDRCAPDPVDPEIDGGPCDTSAGLGCCLGGAGEPVCVSQLALFPPSNACVGANKLFVGCRYSVDDVPCCWRKIGDTLVALPTADCDAPNTQYACLEDRDCPANVACKLNPSCHGVAIGRCGEDLPCP